MEERRGSVTTRELFTKALTATDIYKSHNRLIIPKADAEGFFPEVKKYDAEGKPINGEGTRLQFWERDKGQGTRDKGRWLEFRNCFWISSKSYVLTTNWHRFVTDYGLKMKDTIKFYECEEVRGDERWAYFMIDIVRNDEEEEAAKVKNMQLIEYSAPRVMMGADNGNNQGVKEVCDGASNDRVLFGCLEFVLGDQEQR